MLSKSSSVLLIQLALGQIHLTHYMYMYLVIVLFSNTVAIASPHSVDGSTGEPGLNDHLTVQGKAVVKARWSLEPGPTVSV